MPDRAPHGTQRSPIEEARAAVRRLEEAQRVAQIGSYEFDLRTGERFYTRQLYLIYGMDPEHDEPLSMQEFLGRVLPEDRARVRRTMSLATRTGRPYETDFRMDHASERTLHAVIHVEVDEAGVPILARGTTQDVTRLRAEEARRRESERRLAEAERMAGMGSFEWRTSDGHVVWSEGMYRLYGLPRGSKPLDSRAFYERMRPAEARAARDAVRRATEALGEYEIDFHMEVASGEVRAMTVRGEAYVERGALHVRGTVQDVTRTRRAIEQQAEIARLGQLALAGSDIDALFPEVCRTVARILNIRLVSIVRRDERGDFVIEAAHGWPYPRVGQLVPAEPGTLIGAVLDDGAPKLVDDWESDAAYVYHEELRAAGVGCSAAVPIRGADEPYGAIAAHCLRPHRIAEEELTFMQAVGTVLATAIERRRSEEAIAELAAMRGRLVADSLDAEERTRRRISEALHDGALQDLLAARQDLLEAEQAATEPGRRAEMLRYAREGVERAVRRLREAVQALHPVVLQHGGLEAALEAAAEHAGRQGGFLVELEVAPAAAGVRDELVLSFARELLANAAKHAGATVVRVTVLRRGDALLLEVADDGRGVEPSAVATAPQRGHIGLASLGQRADAAGGALEVDAGEGRGTIVRATLPVEAGGA